MYILTYYLYLSQDTYTHTHTIEVSVHVSVSITFTTSLPEALNLSAHVLRMNLLNALRCICLLAILTPLLLGSRQ